MFTCYFAVYFRSLGSLHTGIPAFCCQQRFFPTQQFDAALSGITFATPICKPSVTLLLPNLLPSSLLPPAGRGRKYIQLHTKFEPQPLPPAKKCTNINRLQALHLFGLFLLNLLYIDFFFIFSQLVNLWVFQHFFFCCCSAALAVFSSKRRYPELPRQRCDWLLGRFTHRSHHAPPLLP